MKTTFEYDSQPCLMDMTPGDSGNSYRVTMGDETVEVVILRAENGKLDFLIGGERITAYVSSDGAKRWVTVNGRTFVLTKPAAGAKRSGGKHDHTGELTAPMPGQVRAVNVREGDAVTKGQTLLVLEAMKMEIRIQSPMDGVVKSLKVKIGQTVEREQILMEIEDN